MKPSALLCSLLLVAAAAQAVPPHPKTPEASTAQIFGVPPLGSRGQINDRALYYLLSTGGRELKLEVSLNGHFYLEEKMTLPPGVSGTTFELLAGDTAHRDRLFKLSEESGNRLQVSLLVDGRVVLDGSFQELVKASHDLQRLPFRLARPVKLVRTFSPEADPATHLPAPHPGLPTKGYYDQTCVQACEDERTSCYPEECPETRSCQYCDDQYDACFYNCYVCTDPKSVSNFDGQPYIASFQWYGTQCRIDQFNQYSYYDQDYVDVRTDHYQRTEYCDGHHVDTYLYSTDSYGWCEHPTYFPCDFPNGYPFYVCY
jgi:hypothetical protein